jgi:hypothetical protein
MAQIDLSVVFGNVDAIQMILSQLTGQKLAGLGLVGAVIQVLMILLRTDLVVKYIGEVNGQLRFAAVACLSMVGGIITLMSGGLTLGAAVMHSTTLAAFQVFFHQMYTVYIEKKKKA